jgi:Outer membrane protein beta-barrel domain
MKSEVRTVFLLGIFLALSSTQPLWAQLESPCEDHCKINTNLAGIVNAPLNPTAALVTVGRGGVAGMGYNFNKRHAIIGEFMWNRVYPEANSLQLLRTVLENSNLNAFTDFYVLTGNYRFELRGQFFGTYFIGGGGLYVRYSHLSQSVTVLGFGTPCTQTLLWWGFNCAGGIVSASQTLASATSSALGGNAGGGMTFRVGGAPYRIYAEARYHYAPTRNINTQFVTVAVGMRY